jgi:hypothetical protein
MPVQSALAISLASLIALLGQPAQAQPQTQQSCVDVQVGSAQSYDCLNQRLQAVARQAQKSSAGADAPYSATSPGNVTGQFNESATRNRLGANFGKSVTPERPVTTYSGAFGSPR